MAFLFKSKKHQDREKDRVLTSREGPTSGSQQSSVASIGARIAKDEKPFQRSTPNGSLNSLDNDATGSPDRAVNNRRPPVAEQTPLTAAPAAAQGQPPPAGDLQFRNGPGPAVGSSNMSLYPWSQRRLTYTSSTVSPFPRYGASVNSTASKEGDIYVMGGLTNSQTVKGDLWMIEAGGNMSCYQLATTSEGPSPRVGHASLLVGNAFIVYGGDTKIDESDVLDETLYLLNTSTRQWSRALPAGPRPSGRYGHTLNILGSKIFIFGGQVEGFFMNDLAAFDLNQLQMPNNRWEILVPNETGAAQGKIPPARTNHTIVSYNDKMYLFGGTNGFQWFNDVWCYDPVTNSWSQLDCIGYIPVEREGHAAALVDDVMYVFGGRTEEGADLGDLAAFRISSRRWYTFQNMGPSPSPRSGHSMTAVGKSIAVLGGEPSSATTTVNDLSLVYLLDTNKIRYPNDAQIPPNGTRPPNGQRRPSDATRAVQPRDGSQGPISGDHKRPMGPGGGPGGPPGGPPPGGPGGGPGGPGGPGGVGSPINGYKSPNGLDTNPGDGSSSPVNGMSKLPRAAGPSPPATSPPQGQLPKPNQPHPPNQGRPRNASAERGGYSASPARSNSGSAQSPGMRGSPRDVNGFQQNGNRPPLSQGLRPGPRGDPAGAPQSARPPPVATGPEVTGAASAAGGSMASAAAAGGAASPVASRPRGPPAQMSMDNAADMAVRQAPVNRPSSPPPPARQGGGNPLARRSSNRNSQTVAVLKELDSARNRNAWYASELELARKAGYVSNASLSPLLDGRGSETFDDDDKPLIEALLAMRTELANVQASVDKQAVLAAKQIAEADKQRDAAIQEAVYAKAKLAAHTGTGSAASTPQLDRDRDIADRATDISRKLATALASQKELQAQLDRKSAEADAEKRSRKLADDTLAAAQRRMTELESYKQHTSYELEGLKAELHRAQHEAREEAVKAVEAAAALEMLRIEKEDFERQYNDAAGNAKETDDSFESLREAMVASADIKTVLEQKLLQERAQREEAEAKLVTVKAELEGRTVEVMTLTQRLRDTEELAERHASESRAHRLAIVNGLDKMKSRDLSNTSNKADTDRIAALQSQLEAAKVLAKKHHQDADTASDRLRSAEERIAGLEAYQEQASREGVTIRRQLQGALRETQTLQALSSDLKHQLSHQQLETNAVTVQHNTLKEILSERGISPTSSARPRGSPREGSPEQEARIRNLERQLSSALAGHEETKQLYSAQATEAETLYRDKLTQLENDYQSAVHYVKGTEKMLKQLQEQLTRYKAENMRLKAEVDELEETRARSGGGNSMPADWETERLALTEKVEALQSDLELAQAQLGNELQLVRQELEGVKRERDAAVRSGEEATTRLASARHDYEQLHRESTQLERRAQDAEMKVGMLLDQVESSVGNYRRVSRQITIVGPDQFRDLKTGSGGSTAAAAAAGLERGTLGSTLGGTLGGTAGGLAPMAANGQLGGGSFGHARQDSSEAGSTYGEARNSAALDNLANELETLRSHWEATNKNYRLSNAFDFDNGGAGGGNNNGRAASSSPTKDGKEDGGLGLSESLADWRKRLDS
ncbi:cell polarity protein [Grosmannia clavigera kw1407]|uniref:Cell polarity protein n=1 Tax=Grosmannia clavigera (strain kw1407 / UAMH 11150) TaxID=655863 RepID=F0XJ88_GROCL|nr:cell polarity protein [Grosmannia clavigera kw1407]EFX02401.1 cell polarity protein [Grosmannia clavigera kw1407]